MGTSHKGCVFGRALGRHPGVQSGLDAGPRLTEKAAANHMARQDSDKELAFKMEKLDGLIKADRQHVLDMMRADNSLVI